MSDAEIINLADYRNPGNGARETLGDILRRLDADGPINGLSRADQILALLWYDGFKVVPLDSSDR